MIAVHDACDRLVTGISLIVGSAMVLVGSVLHPPHSTFSSVLQAAMSDRTRWFASHVLWLAGLLLFVSGILWLGGMVRRRHPILGIIGTLLSMIGLAGITLLIGTDIVAWAMAGADVDHVAVQQVLERLDRSPAALAVLGTPAALGTIGIGLLSVGMAREPLIGATRSILLATGFGGWLGGIPVPGVTIVGAMLLVVVLGPLGWKLTTSAAPSRGFPESRARAHPHQVSALVQGASPRTHPVLPVRAAGGGFFHEQ